MSIRATVPLALVFAVSAWSSGLTPTAVGSNAMGGADVASVEGIEALQVNPAALGLMNADVAMRPGESRQSFHLNVSSTILTRGLTDVAKLVNRHRNNLSQTNIDTLLAKDPSLFDALWDLNRRPIDVRPELQLSLACGNMAFSGWALGDAGMTLHHQALLPSVDVADTVSFGGQVGMSQTIIHNELWAGISAKVLLAETGHYTIRASLDGQSDSLDDKIKDQVYLRKLGWAGAADLGVLWLPALDWRIGSALRDVGLHVNGETVTPQWDVGVSWLPPVRAARGRLEAPACPFRSRHRPVGIAERMETAFQAGLGCGTHHHAAAVENGGLAIEGRLPGRIPHRRNRSGSAADRAPRRVHLGTRGGLVHGAVARPHLESALGHRLVTDLQKKLPSNLPLAIFAASAVRLEHVRLS